MLTKTIVRDQVREHLLQEIRKGRLQVGRTINLAAVSRRLGVSVTPVREALTQLQQSKIIEAVPNRGFIIPFLGVEEAGHLYGLLANLESLALEESEFGEAEIAKLNQLQEAFEQAGTGLEKLNRDLDFHQKLTRNYHNPIAQQIMADLRARIFFYEGILVQHDTYYGNAHNQHRSMVTAIAENNAPTAALILKMNWLQSLGYVQKLLQQGTD